MTKKVGILTSGGDAPGLNPVIAGFTRTAIKQGYEVVGFLDGWKGLIEGDIEALTLEKVKEIVQEGGTILGSSRTNPRKIDNGFEKILETLKNENIYAFAACGGDDTLGVAKILNEKGANVVGVPKTIDNDLEATDQTFGFDTSINIAIDAIDRLRTTAKSHHRIFVLELMGRHSGWIALEAGMAGNVNAIIIPEFEYSIDELCNLLKNRHEGNRTYSIVVIAEGVVFPEMKEKIDKAGKDSFGNVILADLKVGEFLAEEIKARTGLPVRGVTLGHIQRGGPPSAYDRFLGLRYGAKAAELIIEGKFGRMASLQGTQIVDVPIERAVAERKVVSKDLWLLAKSFFG
ncbi:MAG TPA: ATP-dependent 6-phosphofructokinase [candidate division Zixibacteria bacterium]|nr:ATP-dependent 6-phosphofructokinase [candidate division Zixibacteria bacterium]